MTGIPAGRQDGLSSERQAAIGRTQRLKYAVKVAIAHGLYYTGVLHLWQRVVLRQKAVVLMYHRVLDGPERAASGSHPGIIVSRETFARHLALLKRSFVVLSADEFAERIERRIPFPDASCLITFDDGWIDNLTNALPALRAHELPALIFLPVNYIGERRLFWQESLTHLLGQVLREVREHPQARGRFAAILDDVGLAATLDVTDADPRESISEAVGALKALDVPRVRRLAADLADALGVDVDGLSQVDGFIDWQQAGAMASQGIAFGGHGAEHCLLTNVTAGEAAADITRSKQVIDTRLGQQTLTFSYPNGSWNPSVAAAVGQAGYRLAFTTEPGYVGCGDPPLSLRRINIHEDATSSIPMFLARLVGLF